MKKLKRYIIQCVGTTIVGAICAFVFYAHNQQKYYFPLFILLIFVELFYMYKIYTYSYLPGLKLQSMLDEYRRMNDIEEVRRLGKEDLLQEVKEMLPNAHQFIDMAVELAENGKVAERELYFPMKTVTVDTVDEFMAE